MAKKNSVKKRQSRVVDAMRREQKQMEKQKLRERELKERFEEERKSIGAQQRERRKNLMTGDKNKSAKDFSSLKTTLLETGGVLKRKKRRERKNQNKIVKGVRVGNATKIKKNVAYKGVVIKDAASKQAVLDMLKAEDRMM